VRVQSSETLEQPEKNHNDLVQWPMEQFGLGLRMENEARMALLGEQYAGAAQGVKDVVMIMLGTGIGSALPQ
jgi:glucokinase